MKSYFQKNDLAVSRCALVFCGLTEWGVPPRWQVTAGSLRGIGRLLFRREEPVLSVARNTARVAEDWMGEQTQGISAF